MLSQVPAHGAHCLGLCKAAARSGGAKRTHGSVSFVHKNLPGILGPAHNRHPGYSQSRPGAFPGSEPSQLPQAGMQTIPSMVASALQAEAGAAQVMLDILSFHL